MNRIYLLILLIYLPIHLQAQMRLQSASIDTVEQTFNKFQSSVLSGDLDWPKDFVDSNSILYFDHVLGLIQKADSTKLIEEDYSTILTVLYTRYIASKEKLSSLKNSYDLIHYLNTSGIKKSLEDVVVRDIKINGKTAIVYTALPEETEYIPYTFVLQNGAWKINLIVDNESFEQAFTKSEVLESYGDTKSKVIESIVHERSWDNTNKNLWQPQH